MSSQSGRVIFISRLRIRITPHVLSLNKILKESCCNILQTKYKTRVGSKKYFPSRKKALSNLPTNLALLSQPKRTYSVWYHSSMQFSGVGTNFVLGGPRCIGRGGPKQHYIIMSNKINKGRIHTWYSILYTTTWNLIIRWGSWGWGGGGVGGGGVGARPPCWIFGGATPPPPPGSYSTAVNWH